MRPSGLSRFQLSSPREGKTASEFTTSSLPSRGGGLRSETCAQVGGDTDVGLSGGGVTAKEVDRVHQGEAAFAKASSPSLRGGSAGLPAVALAKAGGAYRARTDDLHTASVAL